ncbi:putative reverse transcriptase domain-containing protein [Tanacetum coccineum]
MDEDVVVAKGVDFFEVIIMVFCLGIQVVTKKWQDKGKMIRNDGGEKAKVAIENGCYRCGSVNHWARACRKPTHLLEVYQKFQKNKGKWVEVNFAYQDDKIDNFNIDSFGIDSLGVDSLGIPEDQNDTTHLDVSDFIANE